MTVLKNQSIKDLLYYKIGGTVKYLLKCESPQDIEDALYFIHQNNIKKYLVAGLGSNMLMSDEFFDGAVILLGKKPVPQIEMLGEDRLRIFTGEYFDTLINFSFDHGLVGLEWAGGLPSTVGGAVRGNAGAFGSETKDSVESIDILELTNDGVKKKELKMENHHFSYRHSHIKENPHMIITSVVFKLQKATNEEIKKAHKIYKEHIDYRYANHPMKYPSCGSVFKNIRDKEQVEKILTVWPDAESLVKEKWHGKFSMGYAIKRFGLVGERVGGAEISKEHANYIINIDNAKYSDVLSLVDKITRKFESIFGFPPELELQIVK